MPSITKTGTILSLDNDSLGDENNSRDDIETPACLGLMRTRGTDARSITDKKVLGIRIQIEDKSIPEKALKLKLVLSVCDLMTPCS